MSYYNGVKVSNNNDNLLCPWCDAPILDNQLVTSINYFGKTRIHVMCVEICDGVHESKTLKDKVNEN